MIPAICCARHDSDRARSESAHFLIPKKPFQRLVREIAQGYSPIIRFQRVAMTAVQEAADTHLVGLFEAREEGDDHAQGHSARETDQRGSLVNGPCSWRWK